MERVLGVGGIFFKAKDPTKLKAWYREHLGLPSDEHGGTHAMLAQLRAAGAEVDPKVQEESYGKFGWVMDPEGNRIELWEPPPSTD